MINCPEDCPKTQDFTKNVRIYYRFCDLKISMFLESDFSLNISSKEPKFTNYDVSQAL